MFSRPASNSPLDGGEASSMIVEYEQNTDPPHRKWWNVLYQVVVNQGNWTCCVDISPLIREVSSVLIHDSQSGKTQGSAMGDLGQSLTSTPAGSVNSGTDNQSDTTQEARGSAMGDLGQSLTSTPAGSVNSGTDSQLDTTREAEGSVMEEPGPGLTTTPAGSSSSITDSYSDAAREAQESVTGEPGLGLTTTPAGSSSSDA
ncbi:uncharacterized protein LOC134339904 isoform X1 [Mobula hypostoma]|uniref:uncharacterized protein LOC134339904 isoform X1 n=1 Tax=Mobula hypostoma TaxID=723540 RepID=UPI002FC28BE5